MVFRGHVVVQISLLPKTLRTAGVGTVVGPFLQVDAQVHVQRGLGEEHLITVFALDLATLVRGLVVLKGRRRDEEARALITGVALLLLFEAFPVFHGSFVFIQVLLWRSNDMFILCCLGRPYW